MCDPIPPITIDEKCPQTNEKTPMQELDEALKACKFGRFHIRLLCSGFARNVAGAMASSTTPYLLMAAECDLNMSLVQKGLLNSMPFFGMCASIVLAGFLTDTFGRRVFVLYGLAGLYLATLASGCSQTYEMLLICKALEGLLQSISHVASVTMVAEFYHSGIKDRMLICQLSFTALSQVAIASMSWALLIQDWKYSFFNGYIALNTWNFYLIAMAQWALISLILFLFIPESPKFLLTQRKYAEVRAILINIYKENTGKSENTYQFTHLWKDQQESEDAKETGVKVSLGSLLVAGIHNVKPLIKKPLGLYLIMLCSMNFFCMAVYNVFRLWFPQLSTIFEHYAENSDDLCHMLDSYTSDLKTRVVNNTESEVCVPIKTGTETYVNNIIIGCIGFLPYCINGILVNKVGKKALAITTGLISVGATFASRWSSSRIAVVSLFSLNGAVLQSMVNLLVASLIDLFPTAVRSLAMSVLLMMGRLGALVGNVTFPVLLTMGCIFPFYTMTGLLVGVAILSFFMPSKKNTK